ncbi:MAG: hypothetical protein A2089_07005 [Elusimicrobia bacterium GWD2_63_28]|nr:MAG: hypothetical protein A2089_07005 [Elusimicrobia bacterium GWD2_63_28]
MVLVVLDSVRADRTSPYGYLKSATPGLSRFAEEAVLFENTYAGSNWTGGSFASILTGKSPFAHGLLGLRDRLPADVPTMQSLLAGGGYETAAFLTGSAAAYGLSRGFGHVAGGLSEVRMSSHVAAALAWRGGLPPEKDFFILLHGNDAHHPYDCPAGEAGRGGLPELGFDFFAYYNNTLPEGWDPARLDPAKWKKALSYREDAAFLAALSGAYDRCVTQLDGAVTSLLRGLEAEKNRPLLVIVTSDHGEFLGERGRLDHGWAFYEALARVPLLIRFPDGRGGRRLPALASHVDLLPTVCGAAGVACPAGLDGTDLASGERGGARRRWAAASGIRANSRTVATNAAYLEDGKKLFMLNRRWRLFDLAADPGEETDLSLERPAEFLRLAGSYLAFSGAGSVALRSPLPDERGKNCFPPRLPSPAPPGAAPCEAARFEAFELARLGNPAAAAARLAGADCPAETAAVNKELLRLYSQAYAGMQHLDFEGYEFSTVPGRWGAAQGGYSVSYGAEGGLVCEADGRPSLAAGCVPPAAALLSCLEKYRFDGKAGEPPPGGALERALRKAGYIR